MATLTSLLFLALSIISILLLETSCKILRGEKYEYFGEFSVIDRNARITSNCIRNITGKTSLPRCTYECFVEPKCKSFNIHEIGGVCELITISKFDVSGALRRDVKWAHYETDDDSPEIGKLCRQLKPCKDFQVCEITFQASPAYVCKCRDGFYGDKCQEYKGPGTTENNHAASCDLLLGRSKFIPDGNYWLHGRNEETLCERKVNGGYSAWSSFGECSTSCGEGFETSNRTCTDPPPKGGGKPCVGPDKRMRRCQNNVKCPIFIEIYSKKEEFDTTKGNLLTTLQQTLTKAYRISMEIKVFEPRTGSSHSFFRMKVKGKDDSLREARIPLLTIHSSLQLNVRAPVNEDGDGSLFAIQSFFSIDDWVGLELKQEKKGDDYIFSISKNGEKLQSVINLLPTEFENIQVYAAGSWNYKNYRMKIRNILIEVEGGYTDWNHSPCDVCNEQTGKRYCNNPPNGVKLCDPQHVTEIRSCIYAGNDSIKLFETPEPITKEALVATIPKIREMYSISFYVKVNFKSLYADHYSNIIAVTSCDQNDAHVKGCRQPSVYIRKVEGTHGGLIYVNSFINNKLSNTWDKMRENSFFDNWVKIEIRQSPKTDGQYWYTVLINDEVIEDVVNTSPETFTDMKVYASDRFHHSAGGEMKALYIGDGKTSNLINTSTPINQNNKIATISKICKQYSISFYFKVDFQSLTMSTFYNLMEITQCNTYNEWRNKGCRQPSIYLKKVSDSSCKILVQSNVNNKLHEPSFSKEASFYSDWVKVEVRQTLKAGKHWYSVWLNDEVVHEVVNTSPETFTDMTVFVGNPYYTQFTAARMKSLKLEGVIGVLKE